MVKEEPLIKKEKKNYVTKYLALIGPKVFFPPQLVFWVL